MRLNMKYLNQYFFGMKQIENSIALQYIFSEKAENRKFCLNILLHMNTFFGIELDENTSVIFL